MNQWLSGVCINLWISFWWCVVLFIQNVFGGKCVDFLMLGDSVQMREMQGNRDHTLIWIQSLKMFDHFDPAIVLETSPMIKLTLIVLYKVDKFAP